MFGGGLTIDICLNLGCGNRIAQTNDKQRWLNVDQFPNDGVNLVANLEEGLPFKNESIHYIDLRHVLEHIDNYMDLLMECYRVLIPGGVLHVTVPHADCRAAKADPTHKHHFVEESFYHFCDAEYLGFRTVQLPNLFRFGWLETVEHYRPSIDDKKPGKYFTEILVDLDKPCPDKHIFSGAELL